MYIYKKMSFSLNRNQFVANKLGNLNGDKVLDIGCRDKVFKSCLLGKFEYTGMDYNPQTINNLNDEEYINHNLELGIPDKINFNIINALDVLEHLENIHKVFEQVFKKSNNKVIIALPNMGYYKFRLNFLFKAEISKKYTFHSHKVLDRHRWIPNYKSIINFIEKNKPNGWKISKFDFIAERKRNFIFYFLEKIFSKLFPGLFVYEIIFIFEKNK